jgi:hypothetical protein
LTTLRTPPLSTIVILGSKENSFRVTSVAVAGMADAASTAGPAFTLPG